MLKNPFNRPDSFEIHSHKLFQLPGSGMINSWMRVKTAQLTTEPPPAPPVIIAEQDFNTPSEQEPDREFTDPEMSQFYKACPSEIDKVLDLYFPKGQP
jgi:hypothetical protein